MPDEDPNTPDPADDPKASEDPKPELDDEGRDAELRRARAEAAKYRTRAQQAEKERDELATKGQTEAEKAIAKAREEGKAEAEAKANAQLVRAEAIAAAAGKLRNPRLAPKLLDLSDIAVTDGEVDQAALDTAIADLLKSDPYLAADAKPRPGTGGGGARPATTTPDMNQIIRSAAGRG